MDIESDDMMSDAECMFDEESDFSDQENVRATSKGAGKKLLPKTTKTAQVDPTKILSNKSNATNKAPSDKDKIEKPKKTKTVEETYQKKTQLEHILLRPDTYSK